jgi:hypothetical protein
MSDPAQQHLGRSWVEVQADAQDHCDQVEAAVVRWAWGPLFAGWERLEPLFMQRFHRERPKTRELPEPDDRTSRELFGFDDRGRVVTARQFRDWPTAGVSRENLLVDGAEGPVQLRFSRRGDWFELHQLGVPVFEDDRIVAITWHTKDLREGFTWWRERYGYDGDHLQRVRCEFSDPEKESFEETIEWDADGEVARITGPRSTIYIRPPKGGITPVRKRVAAELVERISAWVARCAPAEPIWALAVLYDAESGGATLPPSLGLAVDGDRDDDPDVMFNPAEWELMDPEPSEFADGAFAEDCLLLNQVWDAAGDDSAGRRLLLDVARELRDGDWSATLSLAADFEVLLVDLELEDLARNRRALSR